MRLDLCPLPSHQTKSKIQFVLFRPHPIATHQFHRKDHHRYWDPSSVLPHHEGGYEPVQQDQGYLA